MYYVGIDLGTTNSAIASFDGERVRLFKSPEQHDVTPSALFFDKRSEYVGLRAYSNAAQYPDNAAMLFKRFMGTSTPIVIPALNKTITPEECSAKILRTLYDYLPEEIRASGDTATVVTVPAAFNQMQKDATLAAAEMAGIGRIALMQEPVAAVMSVMRERSSDGTFLIFDMGGGTLDVAVAESMRGSVSLLAHGGIEMCGGRDFDRILLDNYVKPWLHDQFEVPSKLSAEPKYRPLLRMAAWATEKAKIALSSSENATIACSETELRLRDEAGQEIYLEVQIDRPGYNRLIEPELDKAIEAARSTLEQAGMTAHDIERVVFVGGPTQYKPLRDKVAFELGIAASTDVNAMTAVAEGAAVFAESIDWSNERRGRKATKATLSDAGLLLSYSARTPDENAKLLVQSVGNVHELQLDCIQTGWTSGRCAVSAGSVLTIPLAKLGENAFRLSAFGSDGGALRLPQDELVIARTAAAIDAIPASHTISVEALNRVGGTTIAVPLVQKGDPLPKKGSRPFKAERALASGSPGALNFKLWEGDSEPITANHFIGVFEIQGHQLAEGVIPAGADLICEYEVEDSGHIHLEVSIPAVGGSFHSQGNLYSRQAAAVDYSNAAPVVVEEAAQTSARLEEVSRRIGEDEVVADLRSKLESISNVDPDETDAETTKKAMDDIQDVKRQLADLRRRNMRAIREMDLENLTEFFESIRHMAKPVEASAFDNLVRTARRLIDDPSGEFEAYLDEMRAKNFDVLWRQDWWVIERFNYNLEHPHLFRDQAKFDELAGVGRAAITASDMSALRQVVAQLDSIRVMGGKDEDFTAPSNIVAS